MDFCRLHQYRFERCAKANLSTDTDEQRLDRLRGFATCRQQGFIERVAGRQHANRAFEKGWKLLDDLGAAARSALREDEPADDDRGNDKRSEEHTSELQSLMRISYAV